MALGERPMRQNVKRAVALQGETDDDMDREDEKSNYKKDDEEWTGTVAAVGKRSTRFTGRPLPQTCF